MPKIDKIFSLEITPQQFVNNCSDTELQELYLLTGAAMRRLEERELQWNRAEQIRKTTEKLITDEFNNRPAPASDSATQIQNP